jgi:hypothetical protein
MRATVKDLKKFLETLPEDMPVDVLKEVTREYDTFTTWIPLVLPTKDSPYGNCDVCGKTLEIGER